MGTVLDADVNLRNRATRSSPQKMVGEPRALVLYEHSSPSMLDCQLVRVFPDDSLRFSSTNETRAGIGLMCVLEKTTATRFGARSPGRFWLLSVQERTMRPQRPAAA